jgi:hypothetical protein
MGILDALLYNRGRATVGVADADAATVVTDDQARSGVLTFLGALSAPRTILLPLSDGQLWLIENRTTGAASLTLSCGSGATALLPPKSRALVFINDLGVALASSPIAA